MKIAGLGNVEQLDLHTDVVAFTTSLLGNSSHLGNVEIILPIQTHTTNVAWVSDNITAYPNTDALITMRTDIAVGVQTADCVPILLYASDIKAVAAIHAGWKGTLNGIVDKTICELLKAGASIQNIFVCFGAAVCNQCYEVSHDVAKLFEDAGFCRYVSINHDIDPLTNLQFHEIKPHIDLVGINIQRLVDLNIPRENINSKSKCTRHYNIKGVFPFHSWRRENGTPCRNITFVALAK